MRRRRDGRRRHQQSPCGSAWRGRGRIEEVTPAGLRVDAARGRGGDSGEGEDGGGEGGWRFASKWEAAVAVAVAEGSSAAWRRGSVVGQGGLDRARSWLRVAAHPVPASDARPQRLDRGNRRLCWGAVRPARARAALFAARACRSRSRATVPCQRGRGGGVTHVLGCVWLVWAGKQCEQGRGSIPASSPVKDIVRKMDRAAVAPALTACHCCSDSRGTFIEFIE